MNYKTYSLYMMLSINFNEANVRTVISCKGHFYVKNSWDWLHSGGKGIFNILAKIKRRGWDSNPRVQSTLD